MTGQLFLQNIIVVIWDFDKTLIPGYMQVPLFEHYAVDGPNFWDEVNGLAKVYKEKGVDLVSRDNLYLNHILTYVRRGVFKGLSNRLLRELGGKITFYPGLPDLLPKLKEIVRSVPAYTKHEIELEHYIVSTGLRQMILGSQIQPYVDGVWACEFIEGVPAPGYLAKPELPLSGPDGTITDIAYSIDNTSKTRAVFEINKGTNKHPEIDVNATMADEDRRVPFQNMIYVADGPSDVPVFSIVNQYKGKTFAVYRPQSEKEFEQVNRLQQQSRVQSFGEANFVPGSQTYMWLASAIREIADRIVSDRERAVNEKTGEPPKHIHE